MKAPKYVSYLQKSHMQPTKDFNKDSHWLLMQDWLRNYVRIDKYIIC